MQTFQVKTQTQNKIDEHFNQRKVDPFGVDKPIQSSSFFRESDENGIQVKVPLQVSGPLNVRKRRVDFCVYSLFKNFGYDVDNVAYTYEMLASLVLDLGIILTVADSFSYCNISFGEGDHLLLIINDAHNHALKLSRMYDLGHLTEDMETFDWLIAMPPKGQRKNDKMSEPKIGTSAQFHAKGRNNNKRGNKGNNNNGKVKTEFVKVPKNSVLEKVEVKGKPKAIIVEPGKSSFEVRKRNFKPTMKNAASAPKVYGSALMEQSVNPFTRTKLFRFPDGLATAVAITKNWQSYLTNGIKLGNTVYQSFIHTGVSNCQIMFNAVNFSGSFTCTLANFAPSVDGGSFVDLTPCSVDNIIPQALVAGQSYVIPMHSGSGFSGAGLSAIPQLYSPSELYNADGLLQTNPGATWVSAKSPQLGLPTPFAVNTNDFFEIIVEGLSTAGTMTAYASTAAGAVVTNTTIGSNALAGGSFTTSFKFNITGLPDRLYGLAFGSNVAVEMITLRVLYTYGQTAYVGNPDYFTPYSRYVGLPVSSYSAVSPLTTAERTIASSLLHSDFTAPLNVAGSICALQISSGTFPAESSVAGYNSSLLFTGMLNGSEKKGIYSAPYKMIDTAANTFRPMNQPWTGTQPYTVTYIKLPIVAGLNFRVEVCDIIEYKCGTQQLLEQATQAKKEYITDWLSDSFSKQMMLTENPLHFGAIGRFLANSVSLIPKYLPIVKEAIQDFSNF